LSDGVEDGQIERFRSNGQAVEHGTEEQLQHRLARGRIERPEIRQDGREALCIFRDVIKPNESNVNELKDREARVGVAPSPTQICPEPMGENLRERALSVLANYGACLGIQHPVDACIFVGRSESERLNDPQTEFVLGHAVVAGIQNRSQDRATQEADEQKIIEVASLEGGVLPVVREAEELAFLFGNSAVVPVHPFQGGRNEKCRGRAAALTR
jgi:hypothetical protein